MHRRQPDDGPSGGTGIDRAKLRAAVRRLGDEHIYYLLDDAIELLSPEQLETLVGSYLDVKKLRPDAETQGDLLSDVRGFDEASRRGDYYQSFMVNSKNFMDKSMGTRAFIAGCRRLLDRCVAEAHTGDPETVVEAIEKIVQLLRYIDECHDDVVFFADEGGSWQVGVHWRKVLPAWFRCLSRSTEPDEYARRVDALIDELDRRDRDYHLRAAGRFGSGRGVDVGRRRARHSTRHPTASTTSSRPGSMIRASNSPAKNVVMRTLDSGVATTT